MKKYKVYQLTAQDIVKKEANELKYGCGDVCAICGKPMSSHERIWLHMMPDGSLVDDPNEELTFNDGSEMGYFEVGSGCYKTKFLKRAVEMTKEEIIANQ